MDKRAGPLRDLFEPKAQRRGAQVEKNARARTPEEFHSTLKQTGDYSKKKKKITFSVQKQEG